jgi:hypothetical protein
MAESGFKGGPSRRAQEITPFLVMDILERAKELERQGSPSFTWRSANPTTPPPRW